MTSRVRVAIAAAAVLTVAACGGGGTASGTSAGAAPSVAQPSVAQPSVASPSEGGGTASEVTQGPGRYVDYATYQADPSAYVGGRVVLFFHASWCPNCRRTDENLTADAASIPAGLTVVKVDFDTETDLRKTYGVTQQHTFVAVGPDGSERATWTGTYTAAEIAQKAA